MFNAKQGILQLKSKLVDLCIKSHRSNKFNGKLPICKTYRYLYIKKKVLTNIFLFKLSSDVPLYKGGFPSTSISYQDKLQEIVPLTPVWISLEPYGFKLHALRAANVGLHTLTVNLHDKEHRYVEEIKTKLPWTSPLL